MNQVVSVYNNPECTLVTFIEQSKRRVIVNFVSFLTFILLALSTVSCSRNYLKKVLVDNPEILAQAIKENPEEILTALQDASMKMREKQMEDAQKQREEAAEEEFKNPKNPDTPDSRNYFGDASAPITIVEYSDFQCGFCKRVHDNTLTSLLKEYKGKIRILYKHLPILHSTSELAAQYYEAVAKVDKSKAKAFHDKLFEDPSKIRGGEEFLNKTVSDLGLNVRKVKSELENVSAIVNADKAEAQKFGFSGTPGFLVGGVTVRGAVPISEFKRIIDRHLADMGKADSQDDKEKEDSEES